jgi:predicted nucleic acid-binding protein
LIVVSDTSPVLNLARIGYADLLGRLYGDILVPTAVADELARNGVDPSAIQGLAIRDPVDRATVSLLQSELDAGESAAIALALEIQADLILADERRGRRKAIQLGLEVVGLLGVLSEAKRRGLVAACKPILDALTGEAGFWVSSDLRIRFLRQVDE